MVRSYLWQLLVTMGMEMVSWGLRHQLGSGSCLHLEFILCLGDRGCLCYCQKNINSNGLWGCLLLHSVPRMQGCCEEGKGLGQGYDIPGLLSSRVVSGPLTQVALWWP